MFYCNTPNLGLNQSYRLIISYVHVGETLIHMQILGRQTQKCVWRPGPAWPRWGSYSAPQTLSRYKGEGREFRGR